LKMSVPCDSNFESLKSPTYLSPFDHINTLDFATKFYQCQISCIHSLIHILSFFLSFFLSYRGHH
jgi:hypothetical protein